MGRKAVIAEELELDVFDQACLAMELTEEQCDIMREAAQELCAKKAKKKRKPSEYNIFIGECVKRESGPVTERFKRCVVEWKEKKKSEK